VLPERRPVLYALVGSVIWMALVLAWAGRSPSDVVPTGVDVTQNPAVQVSAKVACSNMLSGSARPDTPLPTLTPQPKGSPALYYRRKPCVRSHSQGRLLLFLDTAVFLAVLGGALMIWKRGSTSSEHLSPAPA
jgi:hypothetical protein